MSEITCNIELRWWDNDGLDIPEDAWDQLVVNALEHLLELDPDYTNGELHGWLGEERMLRGWWSKNYVVDDNNISASEWHLYPDDMPSGPTQILIGYDKMNPTVCMATYSDGQCYDDEGGVYDPEQIIWWTNVPELPDNIIRKE